MRRIVAMTTALATVLALSSPATAAKFVGTPGDDVLIGGPGNDKLVGAAGNDQLDGGPGSDVAQGSSGDDTATYGLAENTTSSDDYRGASGHDQLVIVIPAGLSPAQLADLQDAVDDYHAFLATTPGEGKRFEFSPYGFDLTARGFEDLETNAVAVDDDATTDEDTALSVAAAGVLDNDINLDGDPLSVTEVDGAAASVGVQITLGSGALLTVGANGSFDYDPNGAFESLADGDSTTDSFTYTMTDGTFSSTATVTITVDGVNDAPVAQDVDATVSEDGPAVTTGFDADDIDTDDTPATLTYTIVTTPTAGTLTNNNDGTFTYDPDGDFETLPDGDSDNATFTYTATDTHTTVSNTATVDITINGANDAPVAQDVDATVSEDGPAVTTGFDADDIDTDDTPATLTYTIVTTPTAGTLTNNNDGTFTYDPDGDFETLPDGDSDNATFTYTATDTHTTVSNTATVDITINGANDAPVAQDATFDVDEDAADGTVVGTVTAGDIDAGDSLSFAITGGNVGTAFAIGTSTGTITVNNPPGLDFDTQPAYNLSVTVTDLFGDTDVASVTVNVNDVVTNTPPTAPDTNLSGGSACLLTGAPAPYFCNISFPAGTLSGGDTDGDTLTLAAVTNTGGTFPLGGRTCNAQGLCTTDSQYQAAASTLTVNNDGSFSIHYETNQCPIFSGGTLFAEFEYSVTETSTTEGYSASGIVTVAVKAANSGCN